MTDFWTDPAHPDNDFMLMSDFIQPGQESPPLPISPRVRTIRAKASLYDDDFYDSRPPCRPTRGHPLLRGDGDMIPPGGSPTFLQQQYETSREIREVSGLGYSNDLIEHSLRQGHRQQAKNPNRMPNIALNKTSSASSSPSSTPRKDRIKGASSGTPSPTGSAEKLLNEDVTPPIYDILRTRMRDANSSTRNKSMLESKKLLETNSTTDSAASYFKMMRNSEKPLDINSRADFPDLC